MFFLTPIRQVVRMFVVPPMHMPSHLPWEEFHVMVLKETFYSSSIINTQSKYKYIMAASPEVEWLQSLFFQLAFLASLANLRCDNIGVIYLCVDLKLHACIKFRDGHLVGLVQTKPNPQQAEQTDSSSTTEKPNRIMVQFLIKLNKSVSLVCLAYLGLFGFGN